MVEGLGSRASGFRGQRAPATDLLENQKPARSCSGPNSKMPASAAAKVQQWKGSSNGPKPLNL